MDKDDKKLKCVDDLFHVWAFLVKHSTATFTF